MAEKGGECGKGREKVMGIFVGAELIGTRWQEMPQ
jgi:hypothetical protein